MTAFGASSSQEIGRYHVALGADESGYLQALANMKQNVERDVADMWHAASGIANGLKGCGRRVVALGWRRGGCIVRRVTAAVARP